MTNGVPLLTPAPITVAIGWWSARKRDLALSAVTSVARPTGAGSSLESLWKLWGVVFAFYYIGAGHALGGVRAWVMDRWSRIMRVATR